MTADLRRFEYPLEPIRRQRRWQLDALQAELGRVQQELDDAGHAVEVLREQLQHGLEDAARGSAARLDPARHARALGWLVRLRAEMAAAVLRADALRARRDEARMACARQQRKVDVLERHREDAVAAFTREEETREAAEADRDWLTRRGGASRAGGER